MIENFFAIYDGFKNNTIKALNKNFDKIIKKYTFLNIFQQFDKKQNYDLFQNYIESAAVIIAQNRPSRQHIDDKYFIITFKNTIIIIKQDSLSFLNPLFQGNPNLTICFLSEVKDIFNQQIKISYKEVILDSILKDEISQLKSELQVNKLSKPMVNIWNVIKSCISCYLIKQSYQKANFDRMKYFNKNFLHPVFQMKKDEYVEIRNIGIGSSSFVNLIYHIEEERFFALKRPKKYEINAPNLIEREKKNYPKFNSPFFPIFYGTIEKENSIIIEFINGETLDNIGKLHLSKKEKYNIILQLIQSIQFLHHNHFIYRDLKPNNVMIDANKNLVLIDFDRLLNTDRITENTQFTNDFSSDFKAPEINSGNFSYECDIYSIGLMIYYIMSEKRPSLKNSLECFENNSILKEIYLECTEIVPQVRPTIDELLELFYLEYNEAKYDLKIEIKFDPNCSIKDQIPLLISLAEQLNNSDAQFRLGLYFEDENDVEHNINKAIYYYTLASINNHPEAQFNLGMIYCQEKYLCRNITKAIHYLTLSASHYLEAQYRLGLMYYLPLYIPQDYDKAIYYLSLAANNNHPNAQNYLGFIYYSGECVKQDMNAALKYFYLAAQNNVSESQFQLGLMYHCGIGVEKNIENALYYYSKAADQNNMFALFNIGTIYERGEVIMKDMNKAINYYTRSADQGYALALHSLGVIYEKGIYIKQDIGKAIHYYLFAASQKNADAQYNLGLLYEKGMKIKKDITQAIYYYTLAAEQNHQDAQCNLGLIYEQGIYVQRDINKAIHYYNLAAKQNNPRAQYYLGCIYSYKKYVPVDISLSIYYLKLASNQNDVNAQVLLGEIYLKDIYVKKDIEKAIGYFTLAANQNSPIALLYLASIYFDNTYFRKDKKKSLYYFQLSAEQKYPPAFYNLGLIYEYGYDKRDINKAIHFYTLAANQNYKEAQFKLGKIYLIGKYFEKNIKKAIYYLTLSSKNNNIESNFILGCLYHEEIYVECDIYKSIKFYKEASSFNNFFAKNNLGIIYKNGFKNIIKPNLGLAIEYFNEAYKNNDNNIKRLIPLYNLAHLYLYNDSIDNNNNKSIKLLIQLYKMEFPSAIFLLCIALIKEYGFDNKAIMDGFRKHGGINKKIEFEINQIIKFNNLNVFLVYEEQYLRYKALDILFDHNHKPFFNGQVKKTKNSIIKPDLSPLFYEGFGKDLIDVLQ
ncbi:hypothetical protein M9Y10_027112 [Tritrichomonas musculus]|uniref:Protein kinase domain-containing protein n=1 Tax=Tritrichomonas musculus TaxID=1915356 RepID=A0ABR2H5L5_9EUKA